MNYSQKQAKKLIGLSGIYAAFLFIEKQNGKNLARLSSIEDICNMSDDVLRARVRQNRKKDPIVNFCYFLEKYLRVTSNFKPKTLRTRYLLGEGIAKEDLARLSHDLGGHDLPAAITHDKGARKSWLDNYANYLESEALKTITIKSSSRLSNLEVANFIISNLDLASTRES